MSSRYDIMRRYWPERGIFQGAARAYLNYASQPRPQWEALEKPLWRYVLTFFPRNTRMLDFGAGTGKVTQLAVSDHLYRKNVVCFEPNPILQLELKRKMPSIRAVRGSNATLSRSGWVQDGFSLIAANMVMNHLDGDQFNNFIRESNRMLDPTGTLIYTVPHPMREGRELGISDDVDEESREVSAPWGGFTEYFHRSVARQAKTLRHNGFRVGFIEWGYRDILMPDKLEASEESMEKNLSGFRRLMVIGQKKRKIPRDMLTPRSVLSISPQLGSLQVEYGDSPGNTVIIHQSIEH